MRKIKILGKSVPLWLVAIMLVAIVCIAVATVIIGTITMHWEVIPAPGASMSPSTVDIQIGTLYTGATKTQAPSDSGADLVVTDGAVDVIVELNGDYGGFDAISIIIQLVQGGQVVHQAEIQPTIVVSDVLYPSPTGCGGWSDKQASSLGWVEKCFVRVISGEGDLAQLVRWVPGATITVGGETYTYPETPFGYVYDEDIPETGYIFQNDNDAGEQIQLVLVYPQTSVTIANVQEGTYDIYIGYSVTAGNVPCSGDLCLNISYSY